MINVKKITRFMMASYAIIFILIIGLIPIVLTNIFRLHEIAEDLYEHPFKVNRAALSMQTDIFKIRSSMMEIVIETNLYKIGEQSAAITFLDQDLRENLEIVKELFLGKKEKVKELEDLLDHWKEIRTTIIDLAKNGQNNQAIMMALVGKGKDVFSKINAQIEYVSNFSSSKAEMFAAEAHSLSYAKIKLISWLFAGLTLSILGAMIIFFRFTLGELHKGESAINELKESESKFHLLFETANDIMMILDKNANIIDVNFMGYMLLGYKKSEMIGTNITLYSSPEFINNAAEHTTKLFRQGQILFETCIVGKDGTFLFVEINAKIIEQNGQQMIFSIFRDLTERKKMTKVLEENEEKFRTLFELANDCLLILDMKGFIVDINSTGCTSLGYTKDEMIGKPIAHFDSPQFAVKVPARMAKLINEGRARFESAHVHKDGTIIPVDINSRLIEQGGEQLVFSVIRDITWRKEIENMLSRREAKYRAVIETSQDGFWMTDLQGHFLEVNDAYVQLSEYSREELLTMSISDVENMESSQDTGNHVKKIMNEGHDRFETSHKTKSGKIWPVEIVVNYWNIEDGRLFVFSHDITQRKKNISEIEQSKHNLQQILENAPISMGISSKEGKLIYVNDALCRLLGYSVVELEKLYVKDITYPDDRELTAKYINRLLSGEIKIFEGEKRYMTKEGQPIWTKINVSLFNDISGEEFVIAQIENITERKIAEENLKESEHKFRVLFNAAHDSICITDLNGFFVDINQAGCENLGYTRDEMIGKHLSQFVLADLRSGVKGRMERVISEGHATFESVNVHKDGTLIIIEVNAQVIEQGGVHYLFSINRNITVRKEIENKLREQEALSRAVIERILDS